MSGQICWVEPSWSAERMTDFFFQRRPKLLPLWRKLEADWPTFKKAHPLLCSYVTSGFRSCDQTPILFGAWESMLAEYEDAARLPDRERWLAVLFTLAHEISDRIGRIAVVQATGERWTVESATALSNWLPCGAEVRLEAHDAENRSRAFQALVGWMVPDQRDNEVVREAVHDERKEKRLGKNGVLAASGRIDCGHVFHPQRMDRAR